MSEALERRIGLKVQTVWGAGFQGAVKLVPGDGKRDVGPTALGAQRIDADRGLIIDVLALIDEDFLLALDFCHFGHN